MRITQYIFLLLIIPFVTSAQFNQDVPTEKPYRDGEKLIYTIKFGPIIGGTASMVIKQVKYKNNQVYHSVAQGKTIGIAEKLYSVKDVFESYFDIHTGLPIKLIRDVKEGTYKKHEEAYFDRNKNTAYSMRMDTVIQVPPDILDMVSLL
jgi:hypothetical protein